MGWMSSYFTQYFIDWFCDITACDWRTNSMFLTKPIKAMNFRGGFLLAHLDPHAVCGRTKSIKKTHRGHSMAQEWS